MADFSFEAFEKYLGTRTTKRDTVWEMLAFIPDGIRGDLRRLDVHGIAVAWQQKKRGTNDDKSRRVGPQIHHFKAMVHRFLKETADDEVRLSPRYAKRHGWLRLTGQR